MELLTALIDSVGEYFQVILNAADQSFSIIFNCLNTILIRFCQFIAKDFKVVQAMFQLFDSLVSFAGILLEFNHHLVSRSIFLLRDICNYILDFFQQMGESFLNCVYHFISFTLNLPIVIFKGLSWLLDYAYLQTVSAGTRAADVSKTMFKTILSGAKSNFQQSWEGFVSITSVGLDYTAWLISACGQFILYILKPFLQVFISIWDIMENIPSMVSLAATDCFDYANYFANWILTHSIDNILFIYSSFISLLKSILTFPGSLIFTLMTLLWSVITMVTGCLLACFGSSFSFLKDHINEFMIGTLVMLFLILPYVFMDSSHFEKFQRFLRHVFTPGIENENLNVIHAETDQPLPDINQLGNREEIVPHQLLEEQQPYVDVHNIDIDAKNEGNLCVICQDNNRNVLLLPCRHLCLCIECTHQLLRMTFRRRVCPLCRGFIHDSLEVYV